MIDKKILKNNRYKQGFTLLEVLIATVIFATIMVMTTGVVGQSVGYQSKLKAVRETSNDSRKLSDMISNDIRLSNNTGKIGADSYKNGLALLACDFGAGTCLPIANTQVINEYNSNTLLIFARNTDGTLRSIVYLSAKESDNSIIYRKEFNSTVLNNAEIIGVKDNSNIIFGGGVDSDLNDVTVNFGGYAPDSASTVMQQSFIKFEIISETKDNTDPKTFAVSRIQSAVTSRNYGN